jgi:xanthine dehydrogenase accessory factor
MTMPIAQHAPLPSPIAALNGQWLKPLRDHWTTAICECLAQEQSVVRVLIARHRGSAPRAAGACMIVMRDRSEGTIGGGHLEYEAIRDAQALLNNTGERSMQLRRMILGKELAQCCGGEVYLWLERYTRNDLPLLRKLARCVDDGEASLLTTQCSGTAITRQVLRPGTVAHTAMQAHFSTADLGSTTRLVNDHADSAMLVERIEQPRAALWLYGAGHVGQALIRVLAELPFDITWIDTRAELLPNGLPDNVRAVHTDSPLDAARSAPCYAHHRVLTHDHGLDYALCREILMRCEFASLGLIGSKSKAARFRAQLKRDHVSLERVAQLICPIGVSGVASKVPAAIAVSIAAQLLQQATSKPPLQSDAQLSSDCGSESCASCFAAKQVAP